MVEQSYSFWDIAILGLCIAGAAYYLYVKIFKKKGKCGGGCDGSCK
ncbi:FeoB-associated Cys-rich membrane protein [Vibrio gazogenes]|uniref:Virus attachment protein p12 family protein n=1 Tax=Vibrio gazogenes DSM 21264 = NBRC 103151 TaxID=1123492 RepID=A0A1M5C4A0_VIBGA|nr:FeoB-associated Cys-rich membrane protein [Vibrio gazogenes]USP15378.1 FeoB-associated Cys-rich membrane protein [Vibrio gazogenes]SHF49559.1 hypothetical protein SAMN02745781_02423 [Vibrio gazogenes DSM 21264] [Vibrio gazogenes DSM 21264 = NBRC 103151]